MWLCQHIWAPMGQVSLVLLMGPYVMAALRHGDPWRKYGDLTCRIF